MINFITAVITAVLSAIVFMRCKMINKDGEKKDSISRSIVYILVLAVYTALDMTMISFIKAAAMYTEVLNCIALINALFLISVCDIRNRLIPNIYLAYMAVMRIIIAAAGIYIDHIPVEVMIDSVIGMAGGFLVLMIIWVLTGRSIGAGDIKMFAVIGLYTGMTGIMDILVYSSVFCTFTCIALLAAKKCRLRSMVPMAPFAFSGTVTYFIIGAIS